MSIVVGVFLIACGTLKLLPLYFIWKLPLYIHETACILKLTGESSDSCLKRNKFGAHVEVCVLAMFHIFFWNVMFAIGLPC